MAEALGNEERENCWIFEMGNWSLIRFFMLFCGWLRRYVGILLYKLMLMSLGVQMINFYWGIGFGIVVSDVVRVDNFGSILHYFIFNMKYAILNVSFGKKES